MAQDDTLTRWGRAAMVVWLLWWTLGIVTGSVTWRFVDLANLAFHEAGHVFLSPFGTTVSFLGGTIFQLVVPLGLGVYFVLRRASPFAAACCTWWLGESLTNVAVYMADARELQLDLVGGGEHDWNELFYRFGMLSEDSVAAVSTTTRGVGILVLLLGLAWAIYFLLPEAARARLRAPVVERLPWSPLLLGE
jgi:hypothetical protein